MAPIALDNTPAPQPGSAESIADLKARLQALGASEAKPGQRARDNKANILLPPDNTLWRYLKAGIDLSNGYPYLPAAPEFKQDVSQIRTELRGGRAYIDPGTRADKEKKALFGAAKEVRDLTTHIGVSAARMGARLCTCKPAD
jgi:hypothetical protein